MFRKYKIKKKARQAIELLKEYFKYGDPEVYSALCNCKIRDITVNPQKYIDNKICNEFDFSAINKDKTVVVSSYIGRIDKIFTSIPTELHEVVNFHYVLNLDNDTLCTWDMIIDYLKTHQS